MSPVTDTQHHQHHVRDTSSGGAEPGGRGLGEERQTLELQDAQAVNLLLEKPICELYVDPKGSNSLHRPFAGFQTLVSPAGGRCQGTQRPASRRDHSEEARSAEVLRAGMAADGATGALPGAVAGAKTSQR